MVSGLSDAQGLVALAGLIALGHEPKEGADVTGIPEAVRTPDGQDESQ